MSPLIGACIALAVLLFVTTPVKGRKDDGRDRPPGRGGPGGVSINIYQGVTPPRRGDEVVVKRDGSEVKV